MRTYERQNNTSHRDVEKHWSEIRVRSDPNALAHNGGEVFVKIRAPSKLNLYLDVGSREDDGYHAMTTVFQAIDFYDELVAFESEDFSMTIEGEETESIPIDSQNLVMKAAIALATHTSHSLGVRFHLKKRIPVGGGMGGGSSDAAAALVACNLLWNTSLSPDTLERIAMSLGADVPFLVKGMMSLSTGHQEPLIPVECEMEDNSRLWHWVLGIPHRGLMTVDVFGKYDLNDVSEIADMHTPHEARQWGKKRPQELAQFLRNGLENAAVSLYPELSSGLEAGLEAGCLASLITGSGSTCIFLARDQHHADRLASVLAQQPVFKKCLTAKGPVRGSEVVDMVCVEES